MWHEARKQEKKIRGMMVDYKRRAERRRTFYERIKADPTQFMQIHGRPYKIHLDPAIAQAADSPANMMPWQGDKNNLIDRFDVRAHLDYIPDGKLSSESEKSPGNLQEDRQSHYERYRILVQSDFLAISEEKFLNQIFLEERYGPINRASEEEKKKLVDKKAAIGYVYEDSTLPVNPAVTTTPPVLSDEEEDDDSDIDLDMAVDFDQLTEEQKIEMNFHSIKYGMEDKDFTAYMVKDKEEAEALRLAREIEEEKAMYSGRKSRRERRAFREKRLAGRKISPPSYAAKKSPTYEPYTRSTSRSRSRSPENCGQITFITSFGDEPEMENQPKKSSNNVSVDKQHRLKDVQKKEYGPEVSNPSQEGSTKARSHNSRAPRQRSRSPKLQSRSPRHRSKSPRSKSPRNSKPKNYSSKYSTSRRNSNRSSSRSPSRINYFRRSRSRSRSPNLSSSSRSYHCNMYEQGSSRHNRCSRSPHNRRYGSSRKSGCSDRPSRSPSDDYRKSISSRNYTSRKFSSAHSRSDSTSSKSSSQSKSSRSSSESSSDSYQKSQSKSRSKSLSPRPVRRYRRNSRSLSPKSNSASDSSDVSSPTSLSRSKEKKISSIKSLSKAGISSALGDTKGRLTPQERLKRKMQLALNKQYKADKVAEQRKILKQEKMQKDREDELREMSIKLRRKDRERRHRLQYPRDDESSSRSSRSHSCSSDSSSGSYSRSRSNSPSDTLNY